TGAVAEWFSGSCGSTVIGTGNSITVSPVTNTTYFVRYNGTCNTTTCASVSVTVNTPSIAPTSITGTTTICNGGSTTLTLSGGSAGTGAVAEWFSGSCGSTVIGTGNSITVSPTTNTTYFVRYNGTCNTTTCANATVTVNTLSTAPTGITGTTTICNGASTTLTLSGGSAGTGAVAEWFSGSCGSTVIGTGNSITVSPTTNTTYFVRYNGTCNTTTCASITVIVNTLSIAATSTSSTPDYGCAGITITLSARGYTAGTGASPIWWTGPGGTGTYIGTGDSAVTTLMSPSYYMRLEGVCNTLESVVNVSMGGSSNVILASGPSTNPIAYCEDGLWTYYEHPSLPGKFVFAIKWGTTNTVAKAAAQVFIQNNATTISNEATRAGGIKDASYVMKRYWNVDLGGNTLVSPVDVKFYYDPAEISAMTTARDSELTLLNTITPGGYYPVSFSWFKTVGIPFSPSLINDGNNFGFSNIRLTPSVSGTESGVNYVEFDGITSFSGGTGGIGISPYAGVGLPVTYTSITAKPIDNEYIQVSWITASEINNKGFEVLRSLDGVNFEKIGFVNGNNNSSTTHAYYFDDHKVVAGREYYYRLNQIDYDGKAEKSSIVSAHINATQTSVGEFYPNPTQDITTIDIYVTSTSKGIIRIVDAIGQEVMKIDNNLVEGANKISINTNRLASGVYLAYIQVGNLVIPKRIIVSK
ncbi:MAG: T9SS type A sorting domain-containing protein, partial [Bacteroidota bacterium]